MHGSPLFPKNRRFTSMKILSLIAILGWAVSLVGCSQQQKAEAGNAADNAQKQVKTAAVTAKHDLTDGTITLKVKSAMNASDKLDTSHINVDTKDKVAHIRGSVPTSDQKALAERIAKDTIGSDVKISSELAVSGVKVQKK
jgi:hyperosmotically inducible protein